MSGRKIDDFGGLPHTSDMAMKSKNSLKHYESAEGSGHLGDKYHDTSEGIKSDQMAGDAKTKAHPIKPGFRN